MEVNGTGEPGPLIAAQVPAAVAKDGVSGNGHLQGSGYGWHSCLPGSCPLVYVWR